MIVAPRGRFQGGLSRAGLEAPLAQANAGVPDAQSQPFQGEALLSLCPGLPGLIAARRASGPTSRRVALLGCKFALIMDSGVYQHPVRPGLRIAERVQEKRNLDLELRSRGRGGGAPS